MKQKLVTTLQQMEELLRECGWDDRAEWLERRRKIVETKPPMRPEFREALTDIESVLVGMGSFSDVPMYPKPGARLTRQEAMNQQWDLTQTIGATIHQMIPRKE